jgi:hypothetical protein
VSSHNVTQDVSHLQAVIPSWKFAQRFPSRAEQRAVELGPVELMNLLEWRLRTRPRALRPQRRKYSQFCLELYRRLRRA